MAAAEQLEGLAAAVAALEADWEAIRDEGLAVLRAETAAHARGGGGGAGFSHGEKSLVDSLAPSVTVRGGGGGGGGGGGKGLKTLDERLLEFEFGDGVVGLVLETLAKAILGDAAPPRRKPPPPDVAVSFGEPPEPDGAERRGGEGTDAAAAAAAAATDGAAADAGGAGEVAPPLSEQEAVLAGAGGLFPWTQFFLCVLLALALALRAPSSRSRARWRLRRYGPALVTRLCSRDDRPRGRAPRRRTEGHRRRAARVCRRSHDDGGETTTAAKR